MKSFGNNIKRIFAGFLFWMLAVTLLSQNPQENLIKYLNYRDRLRTRFMVVSNDVLDFGVNIPAQNINYKDSIVEWGDANSNMSHYLSVLASELWILKHNQQDYSVTLQELYYAMLALERLDAYSESVLRCRQAGGADSYQAKTFTQPGDINGFMLRDDVSGRFWDKYGNHFDVPRFEGNLHRNDLFQFEENSQDVIEHLFEGLGLVSKLVGEESVAQIPCNFSDITIKTYLTVKGIIICKSGLNPQSVNFSLWAQDFVKRFVQYMQSDQVYNGRVGDLFLFKTHWVLRNPVSKKLVLEGNGADGGVAMISNGLIRAAESITGENLRIYPGFFTDKQYNLAFKNPGLFQLGLEDNKTRSLACHVADKNTFRILTKLRDTYNPHKTGHFPIYEHFPLMYLVMQHRKYSDLGLSKDKYFSEKALYENLLNLAPMKGPASDCGVYEWTSTSRCLWPENLGKQSAAHIEFNGLDYMMLYNLYRIAFGE